jgi:hypothetical protein
MDRKRAFRVLSYLLQTLIPFLLVFASWATREYSIMDGVVVPAKEAGLNPCKVADWGLPTGEENKHRMYDYCPGTTPRDRVTELAGFMLQHTDPRAAFSAAMDFMTNINLFYWLERGPFFFMINLKVTGHCNETMTCGDMSNGEKFLSIRWTCVDIEYYNIVFLPVKERIDDPRLACEVQFMEAHYIRRYK